MNIVLAHGILGFGTVLKIDHFNGIDYFNGVRAHLEGLDRTPKVKVLVTEVSPVEGIAARGDALSKQITDALNTGLLDPEEKTHILAHSMGGLDSRYILSPHNETITNIAKLITSLTTIGTPHNGSPVADLIDGKKPLINLPGIKALRDKVRDAISKMVVSLDGLGDLTTEKCAEFNQLFVEHPDVRYFSVAGVGRESSGGILNFVAPTCQLLLPSHTYLKLVTKEENDGAVTLSSAQRYELISDAWAADHFDEVGHNLDPIHPEGLNSFNVLEKYAEIVGRLSQI